MMCLRAIILPSNHSARGDGITSGRFRLKTEFKTSKR